MLYNCKAKRKLKRLYERCLRSIYKDQQSSFEMLSEKDFSVSIYKTDVQVLATEMHKVSKMLSPLFVSNIFEHKRSHCYNLQHNSQFFRTLVRNGFTDCPIAWDVLPDTYKRLPDLTVFKKE